MEAIEVLKVVLREMTAIGTGWRMNWSDFDGRTLRDQLNALESWAVDALSSQQITDYQEGTRFRDENSL